MNAERKENKLFTLLRIEVEVYRLENRLEINISTQPTSLRSQITNGLTGVQGQSVGGSDTRRPSIGPVTVYVRAQAREHQTTQYDERGRGKKGSTARKDKDNPRT
ncbi:hypothetical protein NQZ68_007656 [Dissostichus eleginoides]|nr:hypothetical protein NQZ68_007656 [Dissostichus eleginoides]